MYIYHYVTWTVSVFDSKSKMCCLDLSIYKICLLDLIWRSSTRSKRESFCFHALLPCGTCPATHARGRRPSLRLRVSGGRRRAEQCALPLFSPSLERWAGCELVMTLSPRSASLKLSILLHPPAVFRQRRSACDLRVPEVYFCHSWAQIISPCMLSFTHLLAFL